MSHSVTPFGTHGLSKITPEPLPGTAGQMLNDCFTAIDSTLSSGSYSGFSGYSGKSGASGFSAGDICSANYYVALSETGGVAFDGTVHQLIRSGTTWTWGSDTTSITISLADGTQWVMRAVDAAGCNGGASDSTWLADGTVYHCPPLSLAAWSQQSTTCGTAIVSITNDYSGTNGSTGTSGFSGYSGPSGFSGYSGPSGFSGYSGRSGFSGYSGPSGFSGYSGPSGFSGYSGPSGFSGYSGSGFSGYSGRSGFSGYSGPSGFSGYSGPSGFSGYSGPSGFSGYSGPSGFSGYSGRSGFSGYSGPSGFSGYSGNSGFSGYSAVLTAPVSLTANYAGSLVSFSNTATWGGSQYTLNITGYTNLNGFRINGADGAAGLYLSGGQLGFAADGGQSITFTLIGGLGQRFGVDGSGNVSITCNTAEPSNFSGGSLMFYLDESGNNLKVSVRYSNGSTLKHGTIALS